MSNDLKFVELTADVLDFFFIKSLQNHVSGEKNFCCIHIVGWLQIALSTESSYRSSLYRLTRHATIG